MFKQDPFYNRIMARLSKKPLSEEVKGKLKLAAIDDVVASRSEGARFLDERVDISSARRLADELNAWNDDYRALADRAVGLQNELESAEADLSEINTIISQAENAYDNYDSLASELGLNPEDNNEWVSLNMILEELIELRGWYMDWSPETDNLYNI